MRGTNPLSPNRNDMPISGRVSGLGPSVEDALWRGSATVPPVLNVNLSRINLNLRESQSIGPWDGEIWSIRDQIRDPSGDSPTMAIGATTVLGKDTERKAGDSDKATSSIRFNSLDGSNLVDSRWCVTFRKRTAGGGKRKKKKRREWTTIGLSRDPIDHSPRSDCIPQLDSQSSDHAAALGLEKLSVNGMHSKFSPMKAIQTIIYNNNNPR
ncbi:hypothetical protein M747DRAFT_300460 [Aspergillus niger ATCC 13496]|uniref:Uncharacterized protein n=1 Tax=Aspergillus niger ATCC 13496 TaxID=1353008 RepID=A0A370CCR4_ASPNG|nr:hypothetical protein M747DRAFT_300460 [Aspergillus niger ATCC 13496]